MKHQHQCAICNEPVTCRADGFSDQHLIGHEECLGRVIEVGA